MPGRFVVLEGGDGSGKTTQAAASGRRPATARRVGVRDVRARRDRRGRGHAASCCCTVARRSHRPPRRSSWPPIAAQHVAEQIAPALASGEWVVCDRYLPSSLVYQGIVRGLGVDTVDAVNRVATGTVEPDLVIVVDVTDAVAQARAGDEQDRLEAEGDAFHTAVRAAYRTLADEHGWVLVDGDGDVDAVAARVWSHVEPLLPG